MSWMARWQQSSCHRHRLLVLVVEVQVWRAAQKAVGVGVLMEDRKNGRIVGTGKGLPKGFGFKNVAFPSGEAAEPRAGEQNNI